MTYKSHLFRIRYYTVRYSPKMAKNFYRNMVEKYFLCFFNPVSRFNRVKKNKLEAQLILSIFRQPLRVSGLSRPITRRYNRIYTTISTYYWNNSSRTTDSHVRRIISTKCCIHMVVPPDDELEISPKNAELFDEIY